jgi:hypothetical protein
VKQKLLTTDCFYLLNHIIQLIPNRGITDTHLRSHFLQASAGKEEVQHELLFFLRQLQQHWKAVIARYGGLAMAAAQLGNTQCFGTAGAVDGKFWFHLYILTIQIYKSILLNQKLIKLIFGYFLSLYPKFMVKPNILLFMLFYPSEAEPVTVGNRKFRAPGK